MRFTAVEKVSPERMSALKTVEMPKMKGHCDLAIIVFNVNFLGPAKNNSGLQLARSLLIHAKHANVLQKL